MAIQVVRPKQLEVFESRSTAFTPHGPGGIRKGSQDSKVFVSSEMFPRTSFFYALLRFGRDGEPFVTPRHRHNFNQLRFVVAGSHNYAKEKDLPAGWLGFFPAGAYYGPQEDGGGQVLYLQWGKGYIPLDDMTRGMKELSEVGEFKNGVYTRIDPATGKKVNKDGSAAVYEHIKGEELVYPAPEYLEPIPIDPDAFEWRQLERDLLVKPLGTFTGDSVAVSLLRWSAAAAHAPEEQNSQFLFTTADGVVIDGKRRPGETAVWSPPGHQLQLDGEPGAETLLVDFPPPAE
jgi:hypothetical protein